jgi:hypothetical protein
MYASQVILSASHRGFGVLTFFDRSRSLYFFRLIFEGQKLFESPHHFRFARNAHEAGLDEATRQYEGMVEEQNADCAAAIRAERGTRLG